MIRIYFQKYFSICYTKSWKKIERENLLNAAIKITLKIFNFVGKEKEMK